MDRRPLRRRYWELVSVRGRNTVVFHDLCSGEWFSAEGLRHGREHRYVELHCHSAYSFLDGASQPEELAARAAELSYEALALTDHNSVSGSMELAMALAECGPRAIHGAEVDVDVGPASGGGPGRAGGLGDKEVEGTRHLTLLVEDGSGWRNLCRIITAAHADTREGRTLGQARVSLETVLEHAEGLVCLTGCASGASMTSLRPGACSRPSALRACGWSCSGPIGATIGPATGPSRGSRAGWEWHV